MTYYGVEQYHYGHLYRWIFDGDTLKSNIGDDFESKNGWDIGYPMGGSNSSATWIEKLSTDEEIREFLIRPSEPDLDDPELIDLGEYLLTIETDCDSCTQMFLDKFEYKQSDLDQYDDEYGRCEEVREKAKKLKERGITWFDCDDPFYGNDRSMRYSEFCELYEREVIII